MLPLVAIVVTMILGGISGSGPACAAAVGGVMITAMSRAGYPASFSASVVGAAAATDILIPPSVASIIYSTLAPDASMPALFAAGMIPGVLAGVALIVPDVWLSRKHKMGALESSMPRCILGQSDRCHLVGGRASADFGWRAGRLVHTNGSRRDGSFHGMFIGMVIHCTTRFRDLFEIRRKSGELSAVILLVVSLAGIFAYSLNTLGVIEPLTRAIVGSGLGEYGILSLLMLMLMLITVGTFLDAISIFLIFVQLLVPIAQFYNWDLV